MWSLGTTGVCTQPAGAVNDIRACFRVARTAGETGSARLPPLGGKRGSRLSWAASTSGGNIGYWGGRKNQVAQAKSTSRSCFRQPAQAHPYQLLLRLAFALGPGGVATQLHGAVGGHLAQRLAGLQGG